MPLQLMELLLSTITKRKELGVGGQSRFNKNKNPVIDRGIASGFVILYGVFENVWGKP